LDIEEYLRDFTDFLEQSPTKLDYFVLSLIQGGVFDDGTHTIEHFEEVAEMAYDFAEILVNESETR